jgi:hypothetical protein
MRYQKKIRDIITKVIQESISELKFKRRKYNSRAKTICEVKIFYEALDWIATRKNDMWDKVRKLEKDFGNLKGSNCLNVSGLYIGIHPKKDNHRINNLALIIDDFRGNF